MTMAAIQINEIGKLYRLEHMQARAKTFRELLTDVATAPVRRFRTLSGNDRSMEDFWALRDVSFNVEQGEVVGIVGRNGAGKSTLLKVLSRIVEPTCGQVTMRGRVASLLEVGTGFHPELTGRENVYLNGSILGMRKKEIDSQFDAIVDFAEIERFLDTPVKRYSSGMYVRLAFAVAAHLNPEILIVDEVLAVGDAEFQKKCLGKMKEVSTGSGRTVLFVSHNMAAVRSLCTRAVMLQKGRVEYDGTAESAVERYLSVSAPSSQDTVIDFKKPSSASIWMERAELIVDGAASVMPLMGSELSIKVRFACSTATKHPRFGYVMYTSSGDAILNSNNRFQPSPQFDEPVNLGTILCGLGTPPLMPGKYFFSLWLGDLSVDHHVEMETLTFEVVERDLWGLGRIPPATSPMWWPTTYRFSME